MSVHTHETFDEQEERRQRAAEEAERAALERTCTDVKRCAYANVSVVNLAKLIVADQSDAIYVRHLSDVLHECADTGRTPALQLVAIDSALERMATEYSTDDALAASFAMRQRLKEMIRTFTAAE